MLINYGLSIRTFFGLVLFFGIFSGPASADKAKRFDIAAHTVPCHGPFPMRCLIVNGENFYSSIEGYKHKEGRPATIYVVRKRRPEPVPADAGIYTYHRVLKQN